MTIDKITLRARMRKRRRSHVDAIPETVRALLFKRPPGPLAAIVPPGATVGVYHATAYEAPCAAYARYFMDEGHVVALPRIGEDDGIMQFATFTDPYGESDLELGPHEISQPVAGAKAVVPDVIFAPMLAFTEKGERLGQGGGYYDRWFAAHAGTLAIGMGWDCQMVDELPTEKHDARLDAVITPTRMYGPF
ncbi:MAG: 5-formyltetrahydrofolate cyclo-ligase [Pontixanthobacter sp.]